MALFNREVVVKTLTPLLQFKRFRGKINIQRPRQPHYDRAKYLELTKPYFPKRVPEVLSVCTKNVTLKRDDADNPFHRIIAGELRRWFEQSRLIGFFHSNPMTSEQQFKAFVLFKKQNMHYKNYGKKTLEMAVGGTKYETVLEFFCSTNMIVFSPEPEIKKMATVAKKFPELVLLAGIYEGKFLSKDELLHYQQIPNLQSAQAELVQTLNSVGNQIVTNLNSHPVTLVSQLQERVKQLEIK